ADIRDGISINRATRRGNQAADLTPYESDQTTHFSIVDKDGNAVSNTYTINFSYGSGMVADGTGVLIQFQARYQDPAIRSRLPQHPSRHYLALAS
ncbi:gamma-glutamyltransferase, partial [Falsirhodobacter sp. alg1]|uniref:gamma-glutamyltransferase n=1 Tax=Falsirhodobacter sp. alg1 TaxID=1472418 RepID=UPI0023B8D641